MNTRLKNSTIAPMLAGPAPRDHLKTYPIEGMRLLDGETEAEKAAREAAAAEKAAADAAAKEAADALAAKEKKELEDKLKGMTDSEAALLKEQMATKEKLRAATKVAEDAAAKLKLFEGLDPEKVKALVKAADEAEAAKKLAEEEKLKNAGDFERLKTMMAEAHAKEKADLEKAANEKGSALDQATKTINDLTVGSSFSQSDFITKETVLTSAIARQVYGPHFDVVDGKPVGFDKPQGAKDRTMLVDARGNPLPFEQAIKQIVEASPEKDSIKRSKLATGAGVTTTDVRHGQHLKTEDSEPKGMNRILAGLQKGALKPKK